MILLIDNYDSFSYNLVQMVGEMDPDIKVIRNDEMTLDEIRALNPERVILSPGPGRPEDAGITLEAAKELGKSCPVLGVCLGHQAIGEVGRTGRATGSHLHYEVLYNGRNVNPLTFVNIRGMNRL